MWSHLASECDASPRTTPEPRRDLPNRTRKLSRWCDRLEPHHPARASGLGQARQHGQSAAFLCHSLAHAGISKAPLLQRHSSLQPPPAGTLARACSMQVPRTRSRAPALDPATHPAAFPCRSLLPGPPGTQGLGPGLLHAFWRRASTAQTPVATHGAAVSACQFAHLTAFDHLGATTPTWSC